ncbi:MAG: ATP-dependent zinc metalloprotease FtsH [Oscillospiraceae bacterium]|nr:ATP-dependent zinc metalloprotease FtsH [Oscillospiraceae bacterium]
MDNNQNNNNNNKNKRNVNGLLILVVWAVALTVVFNYLSAASRQANTAASTHEIMYTELLDMVDAGQVEKVLLVDGRLEITPTEGYVYTDGDGNTYDKDYTLFTVPISGAIADLIERIDENGGEFSYPYVPEMSPILEFMIAYILPMVLLIGAFMLFMNLMTRRGGGLGGIGSVGKSNAKVYMEKTTGVTFADVAGQDEAKESLVEIIDFLHNPGKYTAIGAKLPKGALLVGSPGTGKTLLAKAVAGEAGVPFFSISGSGFVEMFVGVGASRVRDLFQEAAKVAPCIIFIDEIDAIGKTRDSRFGGGNDEREQTLNQLLAEMDGFDPSKGIIVLAATNRPEVLDKALLRPGRFDRRITVDRPNLAGRLATLQVHTRKIRMAEDVDLNKIAQATAGCVGADLANTVNEAALRAVRHNRHAVNQEDLLASFEVVIAGAEKKGTVITEQEKKIIAYHEVGHALAAAKQKNAQPVTKITIVPHTEGALGYTLHLPEEEKFLMSKDDILTEIRTLLAGRCAEELVFDTQTSGAANDIERATELARNLVARFGMNEKFGMMALGSVQSQYLDGGYSMNCAQETFALADKEVAALLQKCHDEAKALLEENREMLDKIASYLFEKETITGSQMMAILDGRDPDKEDYYGVPAKAEAPAIEPPAKHINIVSEPVPMPAVSGDASEEALSGDSQETEQ